MRLIGPVLASYPVGGEGGAEGGAYVSLRMGRGWGREELMVVNSKTVAVLQVGGGVPVRAGAGAGQDEGGRGLYM